MASLTLTDGELTIQYGRRDLPKGTIIFDEPSELGYQCPEGHKMGQLIWSEFNDHLWCYVCKLDYPSAECPMQRPCWETPKQFKEFISRLPFKPKIIKGVMHYPDCEIPHTEYNKLVQLKEREDVKIKTD